MPAPAEEKPEDKLCAGKPTADETAADDKAAEEHLAAPSVDEYTKPAPTDEQVAQYTGAAARKSAIGAAFGVGVGLLAIGLVW